jgi:hypothetical protein
VNWAWEYLDAAGQVVGRSEAFESRSDAESWIGEGFGDLLEQGIERVRLFDGASERYVMSLRPE